MTKRFAVIGLGHFGLNLSLSLMGRKAEVLALDVREERVELVRDKVSHAVVADSKDIKALKGLGLTEMDAVIVAIGEDFESSMLTTAHLQELGVKNIVNRVVSPVHEKLLNLMKIEDLVLPEGDSAEQLARRLTIQGVVESLELNDEYSIAEVKVPDPFIGKTLNEIDLRKKYHVNLVTVIRRKESRKFLTLGEREKSLVVLGVPDSDMQFTTDDILVVFGKEKYISALTEG
tara:strand:- start:4836 stop:5531 length:696 start_codon:yes stop_codon:yes gene_type:complete